MEEKLENIAEKIPKVIKQNPIYSKISSKYNKKKFEEIYKYYKEFDEELEKLHKKHKKQKCFIVATGPSLKKTNIELIRGHTKIGVNTLYKHPRISCEYFVVHDGNVWRKHKKNLLELNSTLFLAEIAGRKYLSEYGNLKSNIIVLRSIQKNKENKMSRNLIEGTQAGSTVVHIALQIAFWLGFKEIYLIGCDSSNKGKHFHETKKRKIDKDKTKEDNWIRSMRQFKIIKEVFEENDRKIYNSTVGGKLEIFERVKLENAI